MTVEQFKEYAKRSHIKLVDEKATQKNRNTFKGNNNQKSNR